MTKKNNVICIYFDNEIETEHSHTFTFNVPCVQRANNACFTFSLETRSSFLLEIHPCPPVHQSRVKPVRLAVSVDFRFQSDSVYVGWTASHAEYECAHWAREKVKGRRGSREMYWRTVKFHCVSFISIEHMSEEIRTRTGLNTERWWFVQNTAACVVDYNASRV